MIKFFYKLILKNWFNKQKIKLEFASPEDKEELEQGLRELFKQALLMVDKGYMLLLEPENGTYNRYITQPFSFQNFSSWQLKTIKRAKDSGLFTEIKLWGRDFVTFHPLYVVGETKDNTLYKIVGVYNEI
jgi:hypothetical protein